VGIFINSLPIRLTVDEGMRKLPWLRQVQQRQVLARMHEHAPLVDIQNASPLGASEPLFDTLLIFENFPRNDVWQGSDELSVRQKRYIGYTNYPLAIEAMPGDSLLFQVKFDLAAFTQDEVRTHLANFGTLIDGIVSDATETLDDVLQLVPASAPIASARDGEGERSTDGGSTNMPVNDELLTIFSDVLGRPMDPDDDFFEQGGDSLIALRIVTLARQNDIPLELRDIFEKRTVRRMGALVPA
jgi:hypothetical protein